MNSQPPSKVPPDVSPSGASCCPPPVNPDESGQRRILWLVLAINATMFVLELGAGLIAASIALQADSLDMLGDALLYGFSLVVVGKGAKWQMRAAATKGAIMLLFGLVVLGQAVTKAIHRSLPQPELVTAVSLAALAANIVCAFLLLRHRRDDINMRSAWLCSRNDVVANLGVLASAAGVALTRTVWPDVLVSLAITGVILHSAVGVLRAALPQLSHGIWRAATSADILLCHNGCCPASACRCPAA